MYGIYVINVKRYINSIDTPFDLSTDDANAKLFIVEILEEQGFKGVHLVKEQFYKFVNIVRCDMVFILERPDLWLNHNI